MVKLNKLFAMLIAVLGVGTLSAQTDVTSTYLTNAGFDDETSFVTNGVCTYAKDCAANNTTLSQMQPVNGWTFGVENADALASGAYAWGATHFLGGSGYTISATDESGNATGGALGICAVWNASLYYYQDVTLPSGVYEFTYSVYNSGEGANAVDANLFGFVAESGAAYYGATKTFTANSWKTETVSFVLTTETKGKISVGIDAANAGSGSSHHLFVDYVKLTHKPFTDVTEQSPVDLTSMASNTWVNGGNTYTAGGVVMRERYFDDQYRTGDMMTQTVSGLPAGIYNVELYANANWTPDRGSIKTAAAEAGAEVSSVFANDVTVKVPLAHQTSTATAGEYQLSGVKVTDGTLNLGLRNDAEGANWMLIAVKSITYLGPDKSLEEEAFNNNITALNALDTEKVPAAFVVKINNLKTTYGSANATSMALSALIAANGELRAVLDAYPSLEAAYTELTDFISLCTNHAEVDNSTVENESTRTAFTEAITTANTNKDKAVTVEELTTVYNTLEIARQAYVVNAIPANGTTFDLTFKVVNVTFDNGTNGWTYTTGAGNHGIASNQGGAITSNFFENWDWNSYTGTIEQTVTGLPIGAYTVKAAAFRDQWIEGASDQDAVYVFGNDAETLVSSATPAIYAVENVLTYDGKITLGVKSKVKNYRWMGIDNVSLLYVGKTLAFCDEALQQAITKAETVKETLNTAVKETFAQEIAKAEAAKADANRTIASVEKAAADLVEATDLANNIAQAYAKVNALVSTCNGYATNSTPAATGDLTTFNNAITEATDDKETVATVDALNAVYNELETARQTYALKAYPTGDVTFDMTFNVVNPTFTVNTDGWTVKTGKWHNNSGYDGISGIAEIANWGANSWNASISQNVSLPNGKYKVKVAAQASAASTELKLTANEVPTSLTCIGDKGGNIAKDGSVVEMGNGVAGWQYIEVECLVINGTLAIAANSSATAQHCWANVDNFTLTLLRDLTDEERYEKKEANINISVGNKLATCVLPFDAELPVGVNAYTAGTLANNTLKLVAATTLKAFTPYILYAENGYTGTLTGDMDKTAYKAVVNGTLAGAVETQTITTGYALQNQGEGVKFYAVDTEKSQKVTIPAGKCWLDVVKGSTPAATTRSINLSFPGDETTGMKAMEIPVLIENGEIYTIDGKRVETMQSGKIYIIGGQKVIKK